MRRRPRSPPGPLFEELTQLAEGGYLEPVVDRTFPLAEIGEVQAALEAGGVLGKIVVDLGQDSHSTSEAPLRN
ncbi:zinc-binding dehydrogenase [Nesterenkonia flava]|uniref:Zinc-binding dehydrogenase n=1 Tax=Nesterenkonia flava TaxID=469799 RepID=A0ABU1FR90_9MICC|nr:zinc-binding dehydrogenase [Nesterenkonia flava]MDR5711165.1 zinc-binding dehydrogenase [Nesterenkonia flava]